MPDLSFTLVKLHHFRGGLHLSKGRRNSYTESQDVLHSDTLKAALFVCALQLYGEQEINESFLEHFSISSAFPYTKHLGKDIYFFPKPNTRLRVEVLDKHGKESKSKEKLLKKLSFVDKALFEKIICNEVVSLTENQQLVSTYAGLTMSGIPQIFTNDTYQHAAVVRKGYADTSTYYVEKKYFNSDAGLFFLLKADDEEVRKKVVSALRLLADSGIGTDRNNGNGFFDFSGVEGTDIYSDFKLKVPEGASHELALSLYLPANKEELGDLSNAQYELLKRGGYLANPQNNNHLTLRKRSVYMFKEGALFPAANSKKGTIADLKPNAKDLERSDIEALAHPVYRDGRALFIPCKIQMV